jgi:hypothetical protein
MGAARQRQRHRRTTHRGDSGEFTHGGTHIFRLVSVGHPWWVPAPARDTRCVPVPAVPSLHNDHVAPDTSHACTTWPPHTLIERKVEWCAPRHTSDQTPSKLGCPSLLRPNASRGGPEPRERLHRGRIGHMHLPWAAGAGRGCCCGRTARTHLTPKLHVDGNANVMTAEPKKPATAYATAAEAGMRPSMARCFCFPPLQPRPRTVACSQWAGWSCVGGVSLVSQPVYSVVSRTPVLSMSGRAACVGLACLLRVLRV